MCEYIGEHSISSFLVLFQKRETQQLRLEVSFAMKSTFFLLKEKDNHAYLYVSIQVYTCTQINEHYFIIRLFFKKTTLAKKKQKKAQWLQLEMSSAVNSTKFLHKQMENVCSHKEVTRDPPSLLCRKIFCYAENFLIMQKVFCYAEKLCRKFSVMQKNYVESFLVCRQNLF